MRHGWVFQMLGARMPAPMIARASSTGAAGGSAGSDQGWSGGSAGRTLRAQARCGRSAAYPAAAPTATRNARRPSRRAMSLGWVAPRGGGSCGEHLMKPPECPRGPRPSTGGLEPQGSVRVGSRGAETCRAARRLAGRCAPPLRTCRESARHPWPMSPERPARAGDPGKGDARPAAWRAATIAAAVALLAFLLLPLLALLMRASPRRLMERLGDPVVLDALRLSVVTSATATA